MLALVARAKAAAALSDASAIAFFREAWEIALAEFAARPLLMHKPVVELQAIAKANPAFAAGLARPENLERDLAQAEADLRAMAGPS